MSRRLYAALFAALAIAAIAAASSTVETSDAASAAPGNLGVVRIAEDSFRNYDFTQKTMARNKVDWAVDFVFYNNAEIDKVKNAMDSSLSHTGGPMYARLKDGSSLPAVWDEDKGRKTIKCSNPLNGPNAYHIRFYARPDLDRMYNRKWGYYIIATSHIDHNECVPSSDWYGRSEDAEVKIGGFAAKAFGASHVKRDHVFFHNYEPLRREGDHIWFNNGSATFVKVGN